LNVQRAAARTVNQETITNRLAAPMTAAMHGSHVLDDTLRVDQPTAGTLAQSVDQFYAATSENAGEAFLLTPSDWQDDMELALTSQASPGSLVHGFDREHVFDSSV